MAAVIICLEREREMRSSAPAKQEASSEGIAAAGCVERLERASRLEPPGAGGGEQEGAR